MRYTIFFLSFFCALCFSQKSRANCSPVSRVNLIQFLFENDVIFIGEMNNMPAGSSIYELKILMPLKGVPEGIDKLYVKKSVLGLSDEFDKTRMDETNRKFLIYAYYGESSELVATRYSCQSIPQAKFIIYFLKGPYKYRYLSLLFIVFVAFAVWRAGGIKSIPLSDIIPLRLQKTIYFSLAYLLTIFVFYIVLKFNFFGCHSWLASLLHMMSLNLVSCFATYP